MSNPVRRSAAVTTAHPRVSVSQVNPAAIPLTYFLDAYRSHFGFPSEFAAPVTTGLALSAVYIVLAHWAFRTAIERARQTGLLLKMSE